MAEILLSAPTCGDTVVILIRRTKADYTWKQHSLQMSKSDRRLCYCKVVNLISLELMLITGSGKLNYMNSNEAWMD